MDWFIPVGCMAVVAASVALRRRRERIENRTLAQRHGWQVSPRRAPAWQALLRDVSLMRIGHSRRLGTAFRTEQGFCVMPYVCETGFEHRRETHRWRMIVREIDHACGRAAVTSKDWLLATTASPVAHRIPLADGAEASASSGVLVAVAEDSEEWNARLNGRLEAWFQSQPVARSWEVLPGLIVGYEPGPLEEEAMEALTQDAAELVGHLTK